MRINKRWKENKKREELGERKNKDCFYGHSNNLDEIKNDDDL
jgi:hypothetical protein